MNYSRRILAFKHLWLTWLATSLLIGGGLGAGVQAADYRELPVIQPVVSCEQLATADLSAAAGAAVTLKATSISETAKGPFCKVTGNIAPTIGFEVDLPVAHWTQRFVQGGCGAYCGNVHIDINQASACRPALNGEFVVASDDLGHEGGMGSPVGDAAFGADPQKKIDFAYRANHLTTLVAKALIKRFYGQPQQYAYFVGCSDGGREALTEAERFPEDFDGISAGAPVALINVHNTFYHGWETAANKRADGSYILLRGRLEILHAAVIAHCAASAGVDNGLLQLPMACSFDPAWVQCAAGSTDTSNCLSAEETTVAQKIYDGPFDAAGHRFEISGFPLGSEKAWRLPENATTATAGPGGGGMSGGTLKYLMLPTVSDESPEQLSASFAYTEAWFRKVSELAPLYNAANTNLRPFEKHHGKLILWHGGADESQPPATTLAYYQGVQQQLGRAVTDTFVRFFLLPGVGHCGGGDGPNQLDVLTPLMAWTELQRAPEKIIVGKTAGQPQMMGPPPAAAPMGQATAGGPNAGGPPGAAVAPGASGAPQGQGGFGQRPPGNPFASPAQPTLYTRPLYPFPYVAHYRGQGDPNDAASYVPVKSAAALPLQFHTEALTLIGPDNQKFYHVDNGQLVADTGK